jgi:hypothetical protein
MDATLSWNNSEVGSSLPQHIFSLDDETVETTPIPVIPPTASAPPPSFAMDEDQPNAISLDESDQHPIFTLDDPQEQVVKDDAPPVNRPVFDLSSELEEQLPPALSRPVFSLDDADDDATHNATPIAAATTDDATVDVNAESQSKDAEMQLVPATLTASTTTENVDASASAKPTSAQNEVLQRRIFEAMQPILAEIVTEIRRSLEYFSNHDPEHPIERILIYGGTSRFPRLAEYLHQEIGVDVAYADPLSAIDTTPCQLPNEYLQDLAPALPICIGLGIRDMLA